MADGGDNIFVYIGGEQEVPEDVTYVCIDRSVKNIPARAFYNRGSLVSVEMHDGIETVEKEAFYNCRSLRGIKLPGVKEVEYEAFKYCRALTDVEFGDMLETITSLSTQYLDIYTSSSALLLGKLVKIYRYLM